MFKITTLETFIQKSSEVHNNFYSYEKSIYNGINTSLIVTCPIHGDFNQTPRQHANLKRGCRKCGDIKCAKSNSVTVEYFIEKAKIVHGDRYDYSKVKFDSYKDKITIICKEHGEFTQKLAKHLYDKQGCRKCVSENENRYNFRRSRWIDITRDGAYLYLVKFESEEELFYKIGITKNMKTRFHCRGVKSYKISIVDTIFIGSNTGILWDFEKLLHRENKNLKYTPLFKFDGRFECFQYNEQIFNTFQDAKQKIQEINKRI